MSVVHFGDRGIPWWLSGKESACQCRRRGFDPWVGKILSEVRGNGNSVSLPGESPGQGSLEGYSPWVRKELDAQKNVYSLVVMPAYAGAGLVVDWCLSNTHVNPRSAFPHEVCLPLAAHAIL